MGYITGVTFVFYVKKTLKNWKMTKQNQKFYSCYIAQFFLHFEWKVQKFIGKFKKSLIVICYIDDVWPFHFSEISEKCRRKWTKKNNEKWQKIDHESKLVLFCSKTSEHVLTKHSYRLFFNSNTDMCIITFRNMFRTDHVPDWFFMFLIMHCQMPHV